MLEIDIGFFLRLRDTKLQCLDQYLVNLFYFK